MIYTKELIYKKAYAELNEVFKKLSDLELSQIPNILIENVRNKMDTNYVWKYDDTKKIEEQDFLVETKALIVEIYERYLCSEDEKEFWKKYDKICLNMIEENKREEYNSDNIFATRNKLKDCSKKIVETPKMNLPIEVNKEGFLKRIINFIIKFLKR